MTCRMAQFSLKNKRVTILGAARSGLSAARLLQSKNAKVFVSEIRPARDKQIEIEALKKTKVDFEFGKHSGKIFEADLVVLSPGISTKSEIVQKVRSKKILMWSELEVAFRFCPGPIIAISGSNGKTTTTALIGEMFKQSGKRHLVAGNIGNPFSDAVRQMDSETTAIVEVSSFQLETIAQFKPDIGILLNVMPDHLDRYENFDEYVKTKLRIFQNQTEDDIAILNSEDEATESAIRSFNLQSRQVQFHAGQKLGRGCFVENGRIKFHVGQKRFDVLAVNEIALQGTHNLSNVLAATSAALLAKIPVDAIRTTLKSFNGLEHRLEFVRELNGVKYVNDSKATNLESMLAGLNSFQQPLVLIAGGRAKENDFRRIQKTISNNVKKLILIGEAADKMYGALQNRALVTQAVSLKQAVTEANSAAQAGEVVLLCPGCSSFDMFSDFEDRGRQFKELVHKL